MKRRRIRHELRRFRSDRMGSALIEVLLAMSSGSVVFLLSIGLIHQSMHWSKRVQDRSGTLSQQQRLSLQWRQDVHASHRIEQESAEAVALVDPQGQRMEYRAEPGWVHRTVYAVAADPAAEGIGAHEHYDRFRIGDEFRIRFEQLDAPKRVAVVIEQFSDEEQKLVRKLAIESVLNRWAMPEGGGE